MVNLDYQIFSLSDLLDLGRILIIQKRINFKSKPLKNQTRCKGMKSYARKCYMCSFFEINGAFEREAVASKDMRVAMCV